MSYEKKGAIDFDIDGVFNTGSTEEYVKAIGKSLEAIDIPVDWDVFVEHVLAYWGPPPAKIMELMIDRHCESIGLTEPAKIAAMKDYANRIYSDYYRNEYIANIQPVAGVSQTLEELSERYDLGINSSADRDVIYDRMMPRLGINPALFRSDLVHTGSDLSAAQHKPSPYALQEVMRITGYDASQVLMVGDSGTDVLAAVNAGVEPVVTLTGNMTREEAQNMLVDHVIENVTEIKKVLPKALGRSAISLFRNRQRAEWFQLAAQRQQQSPALTI